MMLTNIGWSTKLLVDSSFWPQVVFDWVETRWTPNLLFFACYSTKSPNRPPGILVRDLVPRPCGAISHWMPLEVTIHFANFTDYPTRRQLWKPSWWKCNVWRSVGVVPRPPSRCPSIVKQGLEPIWLYVMYIVFGWMSERCKCFTHFAEET